MNAYDEVQAERGCTAHFHDEPVEAEHIHNGKRELIVLRCTICRRPRGLRLVRKVKP